jgi:hypothetical protein
MHVIWMVSMIFRLKRKGKATIKRRIQYTGTRACNRRDGGLTTCMHRSCVLVPSREGIEPRAAMQAPPHEWGAHEHAYIHSSTVDRASLSERSDRIVSDFDRRFVNRPCHRPAPLSTAEPTRRRHVGNAHQTAAAAEGQLRTTARARFAPGAQDATPQLHAQGPRAHIDIRLPTPPRTPTAPHAQIAAARDATRRAPSASAVPHRQTQNPLARTHPPRTYARR